MTLQEGGAGLQEVEGGGVRRPPLVLGHLEGAACQPPPHPCCPRPAKAGCCQHLASQRCLLPAAQSGGWAQGSEEVGDDRDEADGGVCQPAGQRSRQQDRGEPGCKWAHWPASQGHSGGCEPRFSIIKVDFEERQPVFNESKFFGFVVLLVARAEYLQLPAEARSGKEITALFMLHYSLEFVELSQVGLL